MAFRINGELFAVVSGPAEDAVTSASFEVEGSVTAEYRLTELDQTDPAGRFRIRASGDKLVFQRAALSRWREATDLLTISDEEIVAHVPLDLSEIGALLNAIVGVVSVETPEVFWLEDGYGPTAAPEGYLAVQVEEEVKYIPYWR